MGYVTVCLCNDGTGFHDTGGNDTAVWGGGVHNSRGRVVRKVIRIECSAREVSLIVHTL